MNSLQLSSPEPALPATEATFADRIRLLIQRVGSATEIARMCGFSEGVVRSWRDGNTDPSRARCVKLAKTLGISLLWLVAGEGNMQADIDRSGSEEQRSSESDTLLRFSAAPMHAVSAKANAALSHAAVDSERLNTAMRILQSELELANSPLSLTETTDFLASLYQILGPGGTQMNSSEMLLFNHQLAERLRRNRGMA